MSPSFPPLGAAEPYVILIAERNVSAFAWLETLIWLTSRDTGSDPLTECDEACDSGFLESVNLGSDEETASVIPYPAIVVGFPVISSQRSETAPVPTSTVRTESDTAADTSSPTTVAVMVSEETEALIVT